MSSLRSLTSRANRKASDMSKVIEFPKPTQEVEGVPQLRGMEELKSESISLWGLWHILHMHEGKEIDTQTSIDILTTCKSFESTKG